MTFQASAADPFEGMSDDLSALDVAPTPEKPALFRETCPKCHGNGHVTIGYAYPRQAPCFACNGRGFNEYKLPPEVRKARKEAAVRNAPIREAAKAARRVSNWDSFAAANAEVAAWILEAAPTFEFAAAMEEAVKKFGSLTERQFAACQSALEKRKAARAKAQDRRENAPVVSIEAIATAFATAKGNGLKAPKLRLADFTLSLAPAHSANAGSIYVKSSGVYLGKISAGKFYASRDCTATQQAEILAVCADPAAAAVAYGNRTGSCSCCGRELTDPVSVARGIGPVCAENFGF